VHYAIAKPIETPLSAAELAAYATLHTNKPHTHVYNDAGVHTELTYYTPTTSVQMVHSPADEGKILSIDEHGCVVLKDDVPVTLETLGITATSAELNYVDGVTDNIQTQLNNKSNSDHTHLTATTSANGFMSSADKKYVDSVRGKYDLGNLSKKTVTEFQTMLYTWLDSYCSVTTASA
jgi:hypothetical protein